MMVASTPPAEWPKTSAALIHDDEQFILRNRIISKLEGYGISVDREVVPRQLDSVDLSKVDVVISMTSQLGHSYTEKAVKVAKKFGKPHYPITHRVTHESWRYLADWLAARMISSVEVSKTPPTTARTAGRIGTQFLLAEHAAMNDAAPKTVAPPPPLPVPVPAPEPEKKDEVALAEMYVAENGKLKTDIATVTKSRDDLAREVGRLTTELDAHKKGESAAKQKGDKATDEVVQLRGELTRAVDELTKERGRARHAEAEAKTAAVQLNNLRRQLADVNTTIAGHVAAAERGKRAEATVADATRTLATENARLLDALAEERRRSAEAGKGAITMRDRIVQLEEALKGALARIEELKARAPGSERSPKTATFERTAKSIQQLVADGVMDANEGIAKLVAAVNK